MQFRPESSATPNRRAPRLSSTKLDCGSTNTLIRRWQRYVSPPSTSSQQGCLRTKSGF